MAILITWCLVALAHCAKSALIHRRPPSGIGELLISEDNSHDHYNTRTLMVTFELGCLNEQQDEEHISFTNYNDYHGDLADKESRKQYQSSKVDSIINHFNGCLKHIESDGHFKHFQHDSTGFGISFIDLVSDDAADAVDAVDAINCVKNHVNASSFDYDDHCVHMFTYEPIYHNTANNFGSGYTKFTDPSQYSCFAQDASLLWGLDQLDSVTQDNSYTFPFVNGNNENGVDLYIVDSGVLDSHDQFNDGQVIHELGDGPARYDPLGFIDSHGTHVAGTAGGNFVGVSKLLTIYDYRVCVYSSYDVPSDENDVPCPLNLILTALDMIVARLDSTGGARRGVINLSLGGGRDFLGYLYQYYFDEIIRLGGIPVVSAGNDGIDACEKSPAFSSSAITVGAVDASLNKASFSNFGQCVDVFAPGVDIISSVASNVSHYAAYPGTSMAAPHISGFVANLLLVDPTLNFNQVLTILVESKQQPGVASVIVTNDECATYECVFPIYSCDVLPSNYAGSDYIVSTMPPTEPSGEFTGYQGFTTFDCNTLGIAQIDESQSDSSNFNNYFVKTVAYEPTDVCASFKTDEHVDLSYSYVCVSSDVVEFTVWDGPDCDSNLFTSTVVKTIYDGIVDDIYWYGVDCDMSGTAANCQAHVREWFDENYIDMHIFPDNSMQTLASKVFQSGYIQADSDTSANSDDSEDSDSELIKMLKADVNGISRLIRVDDYVDESGGFELSAFYQSCTDFDTSTDIYEDSIYAAGTCSDILFGQYSRTVSCTDTSLSFLYYDGTSCSGSPIFSQTLPEGCYDADGHYFEVMGCGGLAMEELPTPSPTPYPTPEAIAPWLFIIDDTGSMGNEISGVLNFVTQAVIDIEAAGFLPEYYVLSRFDDPESQTFAVRFEDSASFLTAVDDIVASGGGDCPEYAFSGIRQAADLLDTSSVILASAQAEMFLFTDAPANDLDSNDVASVAALLRAKNVRLHSFYSVGCGLDSRFYDLSITTGGLFLVATSSTFDATLGIMDDFIDGSDTTTLSRLVVDGVPGTSIVLTVAIDSSVECFRVMTGSSTQTSGGVSVYYPDGSLFNTFSAEQQVTTPYAEWLNICLEGTNYGDWSIESTFGFSGSSPYIIVYTTDAGIAFDFSLIDATTLSSVGAFVVYNTGSSIRAVFKLASSANPSLLGSVDTVTLVNKNSGGVVLTQVQPAVSDGASCHYADFAHDDIISDGIEEFYFSIEGTDSDGNDFIRTSEVIYEIVMSGFTVNLDCGLGELITLDLNTNKVCTVTVTVDDASTIPEVDLSFETDNLFLSGFVTVTLSETTLSINPGTNQGSTTLTIVNTDACDPFCEIEGERMNLIVYAAFGDVGDADRFVNFASQLFQFGELSSCRETYGLECNWCKDGVGCMACRPFYTRALSPIDGLYFCQRDESTAPTPEEEDYTANPCMTDNCRGEVNTNCEILEWWGCRKCYDGYFRLNNDHLCVECSIIPNCAGCNIDEFEWGGCDQCESGTLTWDTGLGYRRCL